MKPGTKAKAQARAKRAPRRQAATQAKAQVTLKTARQVKTAAGRDTEAGAIHTPPPPPDIHHACERARQLESDLLARHGLTLAQALRLLTTQRLLECLSDPETPLRDALQVKLMLLREDKVEDAIRLTENAELSEQDRVSQIRAIFGR